MYASVAGRNPRGVVSMQEGEGSAQKIVRSWYFPSARRVTQDITWNYSETIESVVWGRQWARTKTALGGHPRNNTL